MTPRLQQELAAEHSRIGSISLAQGEHADALGAFDETLAICQRLAEQDPGNAGWQQELAAIHSLIGSVFEAQGNRSSALTAYQASQNIYQLLTERDPANAGWQLALPPPSPSASRFRTYPAT